MSHILLQAIFAANQTRNSSPLTSVIFLHDLHYSIGHVTSSIYQTQKKIKNGGELLEIVVAANNARVFGFEAS